MIPATPMGSIRAPSNWLRGAIAQKLQQTSSSSTVVETLLEEGTDLTLNNQNMEETDEM
jgi:hypothetical protein